MNSELFKEHHPHRLSDYFARNTVGFSRSVINTISKHNYAMRALVSNIVLSSLTMILANSLHHKSVYRINPDRDAIENLLCEASSSHFHAIVIRKIITPTKYIKVMLAVIQAFSIFCFHIISYISPRTAHRTLGYIYEKSIMDYTNWIEAITTDKVPNLPANHNAVLYWELKEGSTLIDVLEAMQSDNVKFRDDEHGYADIRLK